MFGVSGIPEATEFGRNQWPAMAGEMQLGWDLIRFYYKPFKNAPYQRQNSHGQKKNKIVNPGAIIYG
jgi:hypothetical protein